MLKRVSEFGRKWNVKVPRGDIHWLSGQWHVSRSDDEIAADIRSRCTAPGYTENLIQQSIAYALECHKRNRELYRHVMNGR